jgi:bacterioferritin (cytochrome b1)
MFGSLYSTTPGYFPQDDEPMDIAELGSSLDPPRIGETMDADDPADRTLELEDQPEFSNFSPCPSPKRGVAKDSQANLNEDLTRKVDKKLVQSFAKALQTSSSDCFNENNGLFVCYSQLCDDRYSYYLEFL